MASGESPATGREIQYVVTLIEPTSGKIEQGLLDAILKIPGVVRIEPRWPDELAAINPSEVR